ncbi:MAG TPA: ABC transporter substrate-binding protein [Patescibacteria group bacterium]|nr:ABC transporter substrate-binding protein [Patescibacteria group bacterium]
MNKTKRPVLKIGYLQITDHLILGISQARDAQRFSFFDLKTVRFDSWPELIVSLQNGAIDGAFIINTLAMELYAKGTQLQCILLSHREGLGLITQKNIKKARDLNGKTIGVPHIDSVHNILLKQFIVDSGLKPDDVNVKQVDPPNFVSQLSRGEIDGYFGSEPFGAQAEDQYIGNVLTLSGMIKKNHIDCVLVLQQAWVESSQDAVNEFTESLINSGRFIHEKTQKASEIGAAFLNQSQKVIHNVIEPKKGRVSSWDLVPITDEFKEMFDLGKKYGVLKYSLKNVNDFVQSQYAIFAYKKIAEQKTRRHKTLDTWKKFIYPLLTFSFLFAAWELLSKIGILNSSLLPAPSEVWVATKEIWKSGDLIDNASASLYRVFSGFILAALTAIPLGLLIGTKKYVHFAFDPLIQIVRTISPISWIPLAILWFGIGNQPAIFIIFITAFFPILLSTALSIKNVDPILLKVGRNFGATNAQILRKIILPAIFPYLIIGLRIALGISWVIVVAAEMVGMSSGLGFMILDARNFLRLDLIISGMLIIGIIGFILDIGLGAIEKKVKSNWGIIT